jgi:hypothetical protein
MRIAAIAIFSLITAVSATAQQINPVPDYVFQNRMSVGRNAVTDTLAYFSIGPRYGAIRGFMPPMVVDTALVTGGTKRNGLTIFSIQKNKYMYWDSVRVQWSDFAGSSGAYIFASDTASMLSPYTRGSGTTNYVPKFTGTRTFGNSSINDSATSTVITINQSKSIGINNATPSSTLTSIAGSGSDGIVINGANPSLVLNDTSGSTTGASFIGQRGANMYVETNGTGEVALRNNSITRLNVNGQGEILIGPITDQGTFTLQNHNGIYAGGVVSMQMPGSSAIRSTGEIYIDGGTGGSGGLTVRTGSGFATRLQVSNDGEVYINNITDAGAYALQVAGAGYFTSSVTASNGVLIGASDTSTMLTNYVRGPAQRYYIPRYDGDPTTRTITPSQIYDNGTNVTIGASAASVEKLYVRQNAASFTTIAVDNQNASASGTGSQFGLYNGGSLVGWFRTNRDGTGNIDIAFPDALRFIGASTGTPTERARINASGELLIGTTTDAGAYALQVAGSIYNTTGAVLAASSGNVGIGTASPSYKLDVSDAQEFQARFSGVGTTNGGIIIQNQSTGTRAQIILKTNNGTPREWYIRNVSGAFSILDATAGTIPFYISGENIGFSTTSIGNGTRTLGVASGTAPTASSADAFLLYAADITAGNAAAHFRTENGSVIKIYQETTGVGVSTFVANTGTTVNDSSTFDGYTLAQVVKALRNLGILQ